MNRDTLHRRAGDHIIGLACWLAPIMLIVSDLETAKAADQLLTCEASTSFSFEKGEQPSNTRYIFSYDDNKKELVKLQEGDRPIAIRVSYQCREDAVQVYCERYDYGTFWSLQLTKADQSFLETIGEYEGQAVKPPLTSLRGVCVRKSVSGNYYLDKYGVPPAVETDERGRQTEEMTESAGTELWKSILASQKECRIENPTLVWQVCWERVLPKKCAALVYQADGGTAEHFQGLYACAQSCIDAGIWDRYFGECARDFISD